MSKNGLLSAILALMSPADLFRELVAALLGGFLAFSNGAAALIERYLPPPESAVEERRASVPFGAVSAALRANIDYQQAAVIDATASVPTAKSVEEALVNVFCTTELKNAVRTTTGSGVFIDSKGVILTNAHVAQFLLLADEASATAPRCVIRQGSPAEARYEASLLFISPSWIEANAYQLYAEKPSGTGEHDFALLFVDKSANGEPLPEHFPALAPLSERNYRYYAAEVVAAGYPVVQAAPYGDTSLTPLTDSTSITHLFTFNSGDVDIFSIGPSDVGEQGSSGGPVVNDAGEVVGLIVTRGNSADEGDQSLRALSISYIRRALEEETGLGLAETLSGDLPRRAHAFRDTLLPYLRSLLAAQSR